jgi:hypothetical protein
MHVPVEGSFAVEDADGSLATLQLKIQSGIWVFDHEETRRFNTKNDCPASSFGHDFFEASVLNGTDSLIHIPVAIWAAPSCVIEGTTVSSLGTPVSISDSEGLTAYVFGPPNGGYEVINYFVPGCP